VAIQGPLRELGIHDVFQLLDLGRKTGVLRINSALRQNEGTIWFHEAAVVAASIQSNPHPLGTALLRAGKIREEDLSRARALQELGDARRIGEILVATRAIGERELQSQVRTHIEDVVFTMLGWSEGYFVFEECAADVIPRETDLRISVEHLLLEGARRIDEWSRIQGRVAHVGVVPKLAPPQSEEAGSLSLTPFEWRVISAADGERDVQAIALSLGEAEFDVARALFGLASAGVVTLRDPALESARAAPRGDADALLHQGEAHLRAGNADAARAAAQAALDGFPDDARTHLLIGGILLAERRFTEADAALREAVRLDPGGAKPLRLRAWALLGAGRLEEAVHGFEAWLALPGKSADEEEHAEGVRGVVPAAQHLVTQLRGVR
jgi:tetratricopeptide (TPR) repeat protein